MTSLLKIGLFKAHSGDLLTYKIECDALSDEEIDAIAYTLAKKVGPYGEVEGVPTGGTRLAEALAMWSVPSKPLLIADDVCTTGRSLEEQRAGRDAKGVVIFARGPLPRWCTALFYTEEAIGYAARTPLDVV